MAGTTAVLTTVWSSEHCAFVWNAA